MAPLHTSDEQKSAELCRGDGAAAAVSSGELHHSRSHNDDDRSRVLQEVSGTDGHRRTEGDGRQTISKFEHVAPNV